MLTPEQIEGFRIAAGRLMDPIQDFLLRDIARRIQDAGKLTSTAAYEAWRAEWLGKGRRDLEKELAELLGVSRQNARKLLRTAGEYGYDLSLAEQRGHQVPFEDNLPIQQIISAAVELADQNLKNITQTRAIQMMDPYGQYQALPQAYQACTDFAFQQVFSGALDYNTAIRQACAGIAKHGVSVAYESGVHTTIEAAVRRNIMGGLGLMVEQIQSENYVSLGCTGWEISAHANSAPDHEPFQGKQYSDSEYQALNNSLRRRISTLNCGHIAFPIVLGVDQPQYTNAELERLRLENEKGVDFDGQHYTGYEATQQQRKIERAIRRQKRKVLLAAPKDADMERARLLRLRQEYDRFSKGVGLRTEDDRLEVSGFNWREWKQAEDGTKRIENLANEMYDTGSTAGNLDAWLRDQPIRRQIQSEDTITDIVPGQFRKHVYGTLEYEQYAEKLAATGRYGPSRLTITLEEAQALVDRYRGTGILARRKDGTWLKQEWITTCPDRVGIVVNDLTGDEAYTTTFKIHYRKDGTHIVPDYPSRKGKKGAS